jgi:hypothetical protein
MTRARSSALDYRASRASRVLLCASSRARVCDRPDPTNLRRHSTARADAMSFVNRLFSYVFNELMVNALANSRTFQRFAVKSDALMKEAAATDAAEMARRAQQAAQDLSKSVFEQSKGGKGPMGS